MVVFMLVLVILQLMLIGLFLGEVSTQLKRIAKALDRRD